MTLALEWKFIHEAGVRGRIEDVVVEEASRSRGVARSLLTAASQLAVARGVYKLSLDCKAELEQFYSRFGFARDGSNIFLVQRF